MKISIVAVGQRQPGWADEATREFLSRLPSDFAVQLKEVRPEPRDGKPVERLQAAEAERLRAACPPGAAIVALDERGKDWNTMQLAGALQSWRDEAQAVAFPVVHDAAARAGARPARRADLPRMVRAVEPPLSPSLRRMADLYLASRSPRRRELLKQIGVRFEPLITRLAAPRGPDVDEAIRAGEAPADYVERIAREKAQFGIEALAMRSMLAKPVLSADTVVILDRVILGKPEDAEEATDFLRRLSGRVHEVRTSVAIAVPVAQRIQLLQTTSVSTVRFRALSAPEIDRYVASGDPMDKAGAYGIQGYAGIFVERLEGSYTGVMGLPLHETAVLLRQAGLRV